MGDSTNQTKTPAKSSLNQDQEEVLLPPKVKRDFCRILDRNPNVFVVVFPSFFLSKQQKTRNQAGSGLLDHYLKRINGAERPPTTNPKGSIVITED